MPRGVDYKIPLKDLLGAAEEHAAGFSLRSIARRGWRQWNYASQGSALEGLRHALRSIDAPVRDRVEATILASTVHGHGTRAKRARSSEEWLAHRRWQKRRRRIASGLAVRPPATEAELAEAIEAG